MALLNGVRLNRARSILEIAAEANAVLERQEADQVFGSTALPMVEISFSPHEMEFLRQYASEASGNRRRIDDPNGMLAATIALCLNEEGVQNVTCSAVNNAKYPTLEGATFRVQKILEA